MRLEWISSAEANKFVKVVTEFTEQIRTLGPNPVAKSYGQPLEALELALMPSAAPGYRLRLRQLPISRKGLMICVKGYLI